MCVCVLVCVCACVCVIVCVSVIVCVIVCVCDCVCVCVYVCDCVCVCMGLCVSCYICTSTSLPVSSHSFPQKFCRLLSWINFESVEKYWERLGQRGWHDGWHQKCSGALLRTAAGSRLPGHNQPSQAQPTMRPTMCIIQHHARRTRLKSIKYIRC